MKRVIYNIILVSLILLGFTDCKKKTKTPEAIRIIFQANAQKFCTAIVGCMQKEIEDRMKSDPKRKDMVLNRMNKDLCRKNQYDLLGSLQANPMGPLAVGYNKKLYHDYEACANSLSKATSCTEIKKIYNQLPECTRVRKKKL